VPIARLSALARSPHGRKAIKYSMVSVVAVGCSQMILIVCSGLIGMSFVTSNVTAVALSSLPSYLLNRAWVWGRTGSHDMLREVVPFWVFAFVGLGFSTLLVHLAERWSHATIVLSVANLTAFGILWIAKYVVLDALLFSALLGDDDEAEEIAVP
jgi:putative flippase GtrA